MCSIEGQHPWHLAHQRRKRRFLLGLLLLHTRDLGFRRRHQGALLRDLEPFGIKEMVQSGLVAIGRGSRSITGPVLRATAAA